MRRSGRRDHACHRAECDESGADVIELGVPFSDPVADGPVIQRASERALKHGTTLSQVLTLAAEVRQQAQSAGLVVFSYLNPILRMGLEKFCKVARHAGVDGVLVTDLPVEEADEYLRAMHAHDLAPIFLAAPQVQMSVCDELRKLPADSYMRSRAPELRERASSWQRTPKNWCAACARNQAAGSRRIWNFNRRAVCRSGRVCRCSGCRQRNC